MTTVVMDVGAAILVATHSVVGRVAMQDIAATQVVAADMAAMSVLEAATVSKSMVTAYRIRLKKLRRGAAPRSLPTTTARTRYFRSRQIHSVLIDGIHGAEHSPHRGTVVREKLDSKRANSITRRASEGERAH